MRSALIFAAALALTACGDHRFVDGRLSPYRFVVIERVAEDGRSGVPKGDMREELAAVFRQVGMEVIEPAKASAPGVANETLQCFARIADDTYTVKLDVALRDIATGSAAYEGALQKKGPNKRERVYRMLMLDLQARYGGYSQREADLKAQRAVTADGSARNP
jgi:hypothetical protein